MGGCGGVWGGGGGVGGGGVAELGGYACVCVSLTFFFVYVCAKIVTACEPNLYLSRAISLSLSLSLSLPLPLPLSFHPPLLPSCSPL